MRRGGPSLGARTGGRSALSRSCAGRTWITAWLSTFAAGCAPETHASQASGVGPYRHTDAAITDASPIPALPTSCTDDAGGLPDGAACVLDVIGRVIDEAGAPAKEGLTVSACGPTQCNPGVTSADGRFRIDVGLHLPPSVYSVQIHVRPDYAAFYYPLPASGLGPVVDMGDLRILPMPAAGPALDVNRAGAPAQSVTSGEVTLDVGDGVYVRVDVESELAGNLGKQFRALRIPDRFSSELVPQALGVRVLYALEPFESSFEVGGMPNSAVSVRLSFATTAGLPSGAPVEVLSLGSYVYPDWLPIAAFTSVARGHVVSDAAGGHVELDPGEGLRHLTWVALRPSQ